jgi:hypothetical protein
MVVSMFAMNAMAASKAHTATISVDKTTGLKAGDTIAIDLTLDNTADLTAVGYTLTFDTAAFTAETAKVSKVEKCIDKDWLTEIKKEDGGSVGDYWAYYLGAPAYNVTVPGEITFSWAGGANGGIGTDDPDTEIKDNRLIGKFYLKVNENVADGEYTISLKDDFKVCYTSDAGETQGAQLTAAPVTVKVGEDAPTPPPAPETKTVAFTADLAAVGTGYMFTVTDTTADLTADTAAFDFTTDIAAAESVTVGLIVENVPVDNVLSAVAKLVF